MWMSAVQTMVVVITIVPTVLEVLNVPVNQAMTLLIGLHVMVGINVCSYCLGV